MALVETALAVFILGVVVAAGIGIDVARKVAKHVPLLRRLWARFRRRCPYTSESIEVFVDIWDQFTKRDLDFEDRFAIFCDQLGDYLEGLVQRAVDVLEWFFEIDAAEQQAALCRIPRRRLGAAEARYGVGPLKVTGCAICFEEWGRGDDVRTLKGCHHVFHSRCSDSWLWRHQRCPMCRQPLTQAPPPQPAAANS